VLAQLPNAGRMESPLADPEPRPNRRESPSPVPCTRPDRMDSPSPPALVISPSPPGRVETQSPVSGTRLDPVADTVVVPGVLAPTAATPDPADASPVVAGLRLSAPPPPILDDKDIVEGKKEKLAREEMIWLKKEIYRERVSYEMLLKKRHRRVRVILLRLDPLWR
jgi:hypothetical protein